MKNGRVSVGHPVDVATGILDSTYHDVLIPGKVNLTWQRLYTTALLDTPPTPLGPGQTTSYFITLSYDEDGGEFRFFSPEGYTGIFVDHEGTVGQGWIIRDFGTFQKLAKREARYTVTRWDVDTGDVERCVFSEGKRGEAWPLSSIEDATGQALDMLRDATGRQTGVRQRLEGRTLVVEYTSANQVKSVSLLLPDNRQQNLVRYECDLGGRLTAAYDAMGYVERYGYDSDSRMTREIPRDGGVF